jgi:hypothetical protein
MALISFGVIATQVNALFSVIPRKGTKRNVKSRSHVLFVSHATEFRQHFDKSVHGAECVSLLETIQSVSDLTKGR